MDTATAFQQELFSYLKSPEGMAELKPFVETALLAIPNPLIRLAATLLIDGLIKAELGKLGA
jgi:hypothetical protein